MLWGRKQNEKRSVRPLKEVLIHKLCHSFVIRPTEAFSHEFAAMTYRSLGRNDFTLKCYFLFLDINLRWLRRNGKLIASFRLVEQRKLNRIEIIESIWRNRNKATVWANLFQHWLGTFYLLFPWVLLWKMHPKGIHIQQAHALVLVNIPGRRNSVSWQTYVILNYLVVQIVLKMNTRESSYDIVLTVEWEISFFIGIWAHWIETKRKKNAGTVEYG